MRKKMPSLEESAHKKISAAFGDQRISPAILAYKMIKENRAVNEAALAYMINYVIMMSDSKLIPMQLAEVQQICQALKISLEELGLTGIVQQEPVDNNEFMAV
jgi:hypothetical protein